MYRYRCSTKCPNLLPSAVVAHCINKRNSDRGPSQSWPYVAHNFSYDFTPMSALAILSFGLAFISVALGCSIARISDCGQDALAAAAFISGSVQFSPAQIGLNFVEVGFLNTGRYVLLSGRKIISLKSLTMQSCMMIWECGHAGTCRCDKQL